MQDRGRYPPGQTSGVVSRLDRVASLSRSSAAPLLSELGYSQRSRASGGFVRIQFVAKFSVAGVLACLPLLLPAQTSGQPEPRRFELTPYAGYRFGGTFDDDESAISVELDDRSSAGLIFNVREAENTQWEVIFSRQQTVADTSDVTGLGPLVDVDVEYLQGGGTYQGRRRDGVRPYLAATLGAARITPRLSGLGDQSFWSFSIGTGLQIRPTERFGIRLEARAWGTLVDSDTRLFCRSGAQVAGCAIRVDGRVLWQVEAFAGLVFRF